MSAIFDIDGTLVKNGVNPNDKIISMINATPDAYIITGREESERADTEKMLQDLGVQYTVLLMNNIGPEKADQIKSKKANAEKVAAQGPITLAVDDDAIARSLYQTLGVKQVVGASG